MLVCVSWSYVQVKSTTGTGSSGKRIQVFTGNKTRVGQLDIPDWELDLYRSTWNEVRVRLASCYQQLTVACAVQVGLLDFPHEAGWVVEWHNTNHLNFTVFNLKARLQHPPPPH